MRHVSLTCKNHPELRWSCKEIAFTDEGGYNGMRGISFKGRITDPVRFYDDVSGVDCEWGSAECNCSACDLVRAPEDEIIAVVYEQPRRYLDTSGKQGETREVFGFYDEQAWVRVKLVVEVSKDHWVIVRV